MKQVAFTLYLISRETEVFFSFLQVANKFPYFNAIRSTDCLPAKERILEEDILLLHLSVCQDMYLMSEMYSCQTGLLFDNPKDIPCFLVGNIKPDYVLCMDSLERDFPDFTSKVSLGEAFYTDKVLRRLRDNAVFKVHNTAHGITEYEIKILALIVKFGRLKDVSESLNIHRNTLTRHLKQIEKKLGCHDIIQCIYIAQQQSWIPGDLIELKKGDKKQNGNYQ